MGKFVTTRKTDKPQSPCACGELSFEPVTLGRIDASWADGVVDTRMGEVPRVRSRLTRQDRLGSWAARWNIGRMGYRVKPGLYAVGNPDAESPVLVSANYKMSFDRLRSVLSDRSAWILVLDTKGINVWCAAGKGTFGTDEIVRRVRDCSLDRIVSHRKLVVPQLGAPGVSAPEVRRRTRFQVEYGPVRAEDLPAFLEARMKATPEMRRVRFGLLDRLVLVPIELVLGSEKALLLAAAAVILGGLHAGGYSLAGVRSVGVPSAGIILGAFLCGSILGPALLPWLPGRAFSIKGAVLGLALFGCLAACGVHLHSPWLHAAAFALMIPAVTSFVVMNFTGSSTFTSQSGVLREMRFALPMQIGASVVGAGLWLTGLFLGGGR